MPPKNDKFDASKTDVISSRSKSTKLMLLCLMSAHLAMEWHYLMLYSNLAPGREKLSIRHAFKMPTCLHNWGQKEPQASQSMSCVPDSWLSVKRSTCLLNWGQKEPQASQSMSCVPDSRSSE